MVGFNNYTSNTLVNEFGIQVCAQLVEVKARVLPSPVLQYLGTQVTPEMGRWNMNDKVGGRNMVLANPLNTKFPILTDLITIIFGAGVAHPQPGDDSSPSIAAVVPSMDWPEVTKYRALVAAQKNREEIIQDLYKKDPQNNVCHGGMITDGVGEGQFSQVLLDEVDNIRKACLSMRDNYWPRITFVVVQKRDHTRPFLHNLMTVIQGAGVLLLTQRFAIPPNLISIFAAMMLFGYARCCNSVSIVPPVYYAHLAASRVLFG
ncbi:argonaute family protein [Actinidia rufa]|uniref:Argonaute family protein n=1 Tax=Actinidia rufa TaxID=165716 RepID=A0A7J0GDN8_9ERIC|nr:argonaute family protein [Actinidia rufa]